MKAKEILHGMVFTHEGAKHTARADAKVYRSDNLDRPHVTIDCGDENAPLLFGENDELVVDGEHENA